ncbi:hypothetical protein GGI17_002669 [Coemansia sp. S146]|nr:hypothetical protein GGI17_002669 [Coemansia sp. S146]
MAPNNRLSPFQTLPLVVRRHIVRQILSGFGSEAEEPEYFMPGRAVIRQQILVKLASVCAQLRRVLVEHIYDECVFILDSSGEALDHLAHNKGLVARYARTLYIKIIATEPVDPSTITAKLAQLLPTTLPLLQSIVLNVTAPIDPDAENDSDAIPSVVRMPRLADIHAVDQYMNRRSARILNPAAFAIACGLATMSGVSLTNLMPNNNWGNIELHDVVAPLWVNMPLSLGPYSHGGIVTVLRFSDIDVVEGGVELIRAVRATLLRLTFMRCSYDQFETLLYLANGEPVRYPNLHTIRGALSRDGESRQFDVPEGAFPKLVYLYESVGYAWQHRRGVVSHLLFNKLTEIVLPRLRAIRLRTSRHMSLNRAHLPALEHVTYYTHSQVPESLSGEQVPAVCLLSSVDVQCYNLRYLDVGLITISYDNVECILAALPCLCSFILAISDQWSAIQPMQDQPQLVPLSVSVQLLGIYAADTDPVLQFDISAETPLQVIMSRLPMLRKLYLQDNVDGARRFLDSMKHERRFAWSQDVADQVEPEPLNTLSERRMRQMSRDIRTKPDWIELLNNVEMRANWAAKAKAQELTDVEFEYVLDELAYYSSLHLPNGSAKLSAADGVWFSDTLIDAETTSELRDYAAILEGEPDRQKDWYPEDQSRMLYLIDPSLYPLSYSHSWLCRRPSTSPRAALTPETLGECPGSLEKWRQALNITEDGESDYYIPPEAWRYDSYASEKFSWLPSEFRVDDNGAVTIESYINNLHPVKHEALYPIIANVFSKFLPLLEQVVTDLVHPRQPRMKPDASKYYKSDKPMPNKHSDAYWRWKEEAEFVPPQPEPFVVPLRSVHPYSLRGRRLQTIVRMSNVELTPENPIYGGVAWRLAGLANERIIATGVFFYDVANIAQSSLIFREAISHLDFEADNSFDTASMVKVYGPDEELVDGEYYLTQEVGGVDIKDGRCLVFPSIYQHLMLELRLEDSTKPGHCKMLTFYVVDPATRIPSTEIVPPQQQDWWSEDVFLSGPLRSLPRLIVDGIMDKIDYPISLKEAKKIRQDMTTKYKWVVSDISYRYFETNFDPEGTLY